ncbi:MAG: GH92 family glycosyl hydrolase [Candidatus Cryptobacteroides sp.]
MKKKLSALFAGLCIIAGCTSESLLDKVDPLIGSGGHGHVFVGANVPFGMVQLGPQQLKDTWDWCSGYHISDTMILGFSHKHLSGTGIGDLGDVLLLPFDPSSTLRTVGWVHHKKKDVGHIYAPLDHSKESVKPGAYSLDLDAYGVKVRLTATERVGFHEYTFNGDKASILLDLSTGIGWDSCTDQDLEILDNTRIQGYRRSSGWAFDHIWYFAAEFSQPFADTCTEELYNDGTATVFNFGKADGRTILVKVALSPVSCEGAWNNMEEELPGWDFDKVQKSACNKWEQALSKIEIEPMDGRQEKIFYTSLYHTMITPELFSDCDMRYRGADGLVHRCEEPQYTILSLWDTYRAQFPLATLIHGDLSRSLSSTFLNIYRQQGKLPVWHLDAAETDCMVGNPGVICMADLLLKGYCSNSELAYEAMKTSSTKGDRGMDVHNRYGFIPYDKTSESETVAKSMEFAIADASLAKVARSFGDDAIAKTYSFRADAYKRYFDHSSGFIRGRSLDGEFRTPFNPVKAEWMAADYTEGNAWQYTFLVPHDVPGLVNIFGSEQNFINKLDSLFVAQGDLGETASDVTGLVGMYAHGNEPSHHIAYMYDWVPGQQYKCAAVVRHIMDKLYFDDENGVCGNEDCGQMSAWYILSALGIYQVDPACGDFAIGSPAVKSAKVKLANGRTLSIKAENNSPENIYPQRIYFRGRELEKPFISYSELMEGGELKFIMGPVPETHFHAHKDMKVISLGKAQSKRHETLFSEDIQSLNGEWNFRFYSSVEEMLASPGKKAARIKVPGNWEPQGFGTAVYTNTCYDFCPKDPQPPQLPDAIPVGVYSRKFRPCFGADERLYLNIGGVKGGCYVYVNGLLAGYGEDAKDMVRYDITSFAESGRDNLLEIVVTQWSTGSYLECMDFWRLSGIERDVFLSREAAEIPEDFDWNVVSTLDESLKNGVFRLSLSASSPYTFSFRLLDKDSSVLLEEGNVDVPGCWEYEGIIPQVRVWSAETPELYTLEMTVAGHRTSAKIGFRRFEIKDGLFLVNGQPVKFKGVNYHEHNQFTGHYITREDVLEDLKLMRSFNINAIRTCHYPQPAFFYDLCDSLGFYVYSEANVESHGMGYSLDRTLGNNPQWYEQHIDRILNMYYRTRNHACVSILSLGNEGGNGCNFYKAYDVLKALEKDGQNRPVCYERAEFEWNTDMLVPQYPGAGWFRNMGEHPEGRPVCPSEYAHAMGNSTGSLDLQWKYIYAYPHLQGGFLWDWVDQGLYEEDENGKAYWTYGGDYGEKQPSDGNFLCNGIVGPDRKAHPGAYEVKHVYQNIHFEQCSANTFTVTNRFFFSPLDAFRTIWTLEADGIAIASGELDFDTPAQQSESFSLELPSLPLDKDCYLKFESFTREASDLLEKDYLLAYDQFLLHKAAPEAFELEEGNICSADENCFKVQNSRASICFDLSKGWLSHYTVDGEEMFLPEFGLRPSFWRAPNDNDYGCWWPSRTQDFKTASKVFNTSLAIFDKGGIRVIYSLQNGNKFDVLFTLSGTSLKVDYTFEGTQQGREVEVPRIGFRMRLDKSADAFTYFGRGPQENYCDRFSGSMVGLYRSSALAEFVPYVRPQECGHHTGVRRLEIGPMQVLGDFEFNALRCSVEDLDSEESVQNDYQYDYKDPEGNYTPQAARNVLRRQQHLNDVPVRDYVELCIDGAHSGVGGYDSWGATAERERTLWNRNTYTYSLIIKKK